MKNTAIISDIHGNRPALESVLEAIDTHGIQTLYVLGDVINALDPGGCCDLLRQREHTHFIKGNAEEYVCTEDLEEFPWRNRKDWEWIVPRINWIRSEIGDDHREWLCAWPEEILAADALMVHDSPVDREEAQTGPEDLPKKYHKLCSHGKGLSESVEEDFLSSNIALVKAHDVSTLFCGHTHAPFILTVDGTTICNAGSVGMPLDGDPRACWVSWSSSGVDIRRQEYDVDEAISILEKKEHTVGGRLPEAYGKMIRYARHWTSFT